MLTPRATLPTLLGALLFFLGLYAFFRVPSGAPSPQQASVQTTPAPRLEHSVALVNAAAQETRTVNVQAPETPSAVLEATLAALRTWLTETGLWPDALGVPTVFRLGESAVLDFPLAGSTNLSVQREQQLLASVQRTLAQQGIEEVVMLSNGHSRPVFLEHLAVESRLE